MVHPRGVLDHKGGQAAEPPRHLGVPFLDARRRLLCRLPGWGGAIRHDHAAAAGRLAKLGVEVEVALRAAVRARRQGGRGGSRRRHCTLAQTGSRKAGSRKAAPPHLRPVVAGEREEHLWAPSPPSRNACGSALRWRLRPCAQQAGGGRGSRGRPTAPSTGGTRGEPRGGNARLRRSATPPALQPIQRAVLLVITRLQP